MVTTIYVVLLSGFLVEGELIVTTAHGIIDRDFENVDNSAEIPYEFCPKVLKVTHLGDRAQDEFQVFPVVIDTGIDLAILRLPPSVSADHYFSLTPCRRSCMRR